MGYYQMRGNRGNTTPSRKDPLYQQAFNWARDAEYTVGQSKWIAEIASDIAKEHPDWEFREVMETALASL